MWYHNFKPFRITTGNRIIWEISHYHYTNTCSLSLLHIVCADCVRVRLKGIIWYMHRSLVHHSERKPRLFHLEALSQLEYYALQVGMYIYVHFWVCGNTTYQTLLSCIIRICSLSCCSEPKLLFLCALQKNIFWIVSQLFLSIYKITLDPIDFHFIKKNYSTQERKKVIQVWNDMTVSKWWTSF